MRMVSLTLKETYRRLEEDRDEVYQVEAGMAVLHDNVFFLKIENFMIFHFPEIRLDHEEKLSTFVRLKRPSFYQ